MLKIRPCNCVDGVEVDIHVIVCLDNKLGLLAKLRHPHLAKHILVREVVVGVDEIALDEISKQFAFLDKLKE